MNKYINYNDYHEIFDYCKTNCRTIIVNIDKDDMNYLKGKYKGYLYVLKVCKYHLNRRKYDMKFYELYNYLKNQVNSIMNTFVPKKNYIDGIYHSVLDCMNFLCSIFEKYNKNSA